MAILRRKPNSNSNSKGGDGGMSSLLVPVPSSSSPLPSSTSSPISSLALPSSSHGKGCKLSRFILLFLQGCIWAALFLYLITSLYTHSHTNVTVTDANTQQLQLELEMIQLHSKKNDNNNSNSNNSNGLRSSSTISSSTSTSDTVTQSVIATDSATATTTDTVTITVTKPESLEERVRRQMKANFKSLPSPPWPQLDHSTAQAIANGILVGFNTTDINSNTDIDINTDTDIPTMFNNTIVTAYYAFESKHSVKEYTNWMKGLLQTSDPMIVFLQPNTPWVDIIKQHRKHAPTIIATLEFEKLVMSTTFTKEFWDWQHQIDTERLVHKSSGVYKIWNEKLIFLYNAILLNPFQTTGYAWMDIGYFRQIRDAPEPQTPLIKVNYTHPNNSMNPTTKATTTTNDMSHKNSIPVPQNKVLLLHVRNDPLDSIARVNIAGNAFYGTSQAFLNLYTKYYHTFWDWIHNHHKFIGSDQFVITETCRRHKEVCYPYFAGRFKSWFALSAVVMGEKPITEVSPHYLFKDDENDNGKNGNVNVKIPPNTSQLDVDVQVPQGQRITYCTTAGGSDSDKEIDVVVPVEECKQ